MLITKISFKIPIEEAMKEITGFKAVLVNVELVHSSKEIELASYLTKKSFEKKANIANDPKLEFLLWLSAKKDIKSALTKVKPIDGNAILIVLDNPGDKDRILEMIKAKENKFEAEKVDNLRLEEISLSRII